MIATVGEIHSSSMVNILQEETSYSFLQEPQFTIAIYENHSESSCIDGAEAYITNLGNGRFITSNYNLRIPEGYNIYTDNDLELRRSYSGSTFLRLIREKEAAGLAEPIGLNDWIDFHGADYYNMYRLAAGTSLVFQFVGAPSGQSMPRASGYNLKMAGSSVAKIGSRAFFSGAGTESRAIQEGYTTISQTRAGQNLMKLTEGMPYYPGSQAYNWWARLSATYAKGVPQGSKVNVFLNNPSSTGIWNTVERPILQQRGIQIIYR
jgi:hypothetical protein